MQNAGDYASDLAVVFRTDDAVEAHALAGYLSNAGIEARVVGDFLDSAYPGLHLGGRAKIEVWIPTAQRAEAAPLVGGWIGEHSLPPAEPPLKFRYSMMTVLTAITLAALFLGVAAAAGPLGADSALVVFQLMLIVGAVVFVLRRALRSNASNEDRPAGALPSPENQRTP